MSIYYSQQPQSVPACYRHPDRAAMVGCVRCGRPICPECMRTAPVGQQCVDCVQATYQSAYTVPVAPSARPTPKAAMRLDGKPWVTYGLIAVNVAVFLLQMARPDLRNQFALWSPAVAQGQYYRLVSSAFMHYGLVHLGFNMWALYVLGPPLEVHLGRSRYGALYALSALGGSVLVYLISPVTAATAGASGAIYGLFGATFVAAKRLHLDVRWLVTLIAINLAMTFTIPGISWEGHVGGLITGSVVTAAYVFAPRNNRALVQVAVSVGLLILFAVLIAGRTSMFVG
ncbi:MAG: rhomboid family intramembrane serine protease [Mycobacterium sp.]|nr:rhomboid family intramembrane serine protease [Mycobacterium sp.]